ncbi:MAG TPA: DUF3052 family protein [Pyrinomonadaceae bacterium]|nr:DUF3052 family protein [Pyrinomonadaceae bacterium]
MTTTEYSGTPLVKKLGIKPGMQVLVLGYSGDYAELVAPVPEGVGMVTLDTLPNGRVSASKTDILHIFTNSRDELFRLLDKARDVIKQDGMIWVSWYKKAAKLPTEITEDTIRDAALPMGLVDVKVCAIDQKWSGLKLVIRKENRK